MTPETGFEEIEHTADWALRIWAPDLPTLLETAAHGMNHLSDIKLARKRMMVQDIALEAIDPESLLVSFLNELLFFGEIDNIGFDHFEIHLDGLKLTAAVSGAEILSRKKEIKAVTYHNLHIQKTERGLEVEIVFDV